MVWQALGAIGSALGSYLSSREQRKAAQRASQAQLDAANAALGFQRDQLGQGLGFQQNQFNNAIGRLQDQFNAGLGLQRGQFNEGLGLQQGQFNTNLGLQRGFLDEALQRAGAQGQDQQAALQGLFSPYTQAGQQALGGMNQYAQGGLQAFQQQQALAGGLGAEAQAQAISGLQSSPLFQALAKQGEDAILANASATGGLRGGNTQGLLAQFRPGLLNQFVQQQYGNLGNLSALGASNLGALGQFGQGSALGQAQLGGDAYRSNLGFLQSIYGNAAGNVANSSNQLMSGIGNASGQLMSGTGNATNQLMSGTGNAANQFANNVAALQSGFGSNVTDLLGQRGAIGASNAVQQGKANANMWSTLGGIPNQMSMLELLRSRPYRAGLSDDPARALAQLKGAY